MDRIIKISDKIISIAEHECQYKVLMNFENRYFELSGNSFEIINGIKEFLSPYFIFEEILDVKLEVQFYIFCIRGKFDELHYIVKTVSQNGRWIKIHRTKNKAFILNGIILSQNKIKIINLIERNYIVITDSRTSPPKIFIYLNAKYTVENILRAVIVIRDAVKPVIEMGGGIFFHGAAAVKHDKGILICGNKKSGKTTLLLSLLFKKNYIGVAYDRCVAFRSGNSCKIIGWPMLLNVGIGTLLMYKDFFPHDLLEKYCLSRRISDQFEKIHLHPKSIKNIRLQREMILKYIVFPNFNLKFTNLECKKIINKFEIINKIARNIYTPYDSNYLNWLKLIKLNNVAIMKNKEELILWLSQYYSFFTLKFGSKTNFDNDVLCNILEK